MLNLLRIGYIFVKKMEHHDISFRRVGVNAGEISRSTSAKSIQSHHFIKFTNGENVEYNLDRLSGIKFEFDNTVGPKSISKQELIEKFNEVFRSGKPDHKEIRGISS